MHTESARHNAFTLLELLVVIVIMATLAAVVASQFDRARENGWSARCKANLRNLYQGCHTRYVDNKGWPGAWDWKGWEERGWVTQSNSVWPYSSSVWYGPAGKDSIASGTLWEYVGKSYATYLCPKFQRRNVCGRTDAVRSYVMNNAYVDTLDDQSQISTLLLTDLQPRKTYRESGGPQVCKTWAGKDAAGNDGALNPGNGLNSQTPEESMGFVHSMSGERRAHVMFRDGHIEALGLIQYGPSSYSNLTYVTCTGKY